jgi:hypothetical protein
MDRPDSIVPFIVVQQPSGEFSLLHKLSKKLQFLSREIIPSHLLRDRIDSRALEEVARIMSFWKEIHPFLTTRPFSQTNTDRVAHNGQRIAARRE